MSLALSVAQALTDDERKTILENFTRLNPRWAGAEVADIIEHLHGLDAHLDAIELLYEEHDITGDLYALAALAVIYRDGSCDWDRVSELVSRAVSA